jgi:hypothetical protein
MMAANAIAITLGTLATVALAEEHAPAPNIQNLLDRGFEVIADGKLAGAVDCDPQLAPITIEEIRRSPAIRCVTGKVAYGSFKRLKGDNVEFVCVSFQDWACYQSQNSN